MNVKVASADVLQKRLLEAAHGVRHEQQKLVPLLIAEFSGQSGYRDHELVARSIADAVIPYFDDLAFAAQLSLNFRIARYVRAIVPDEAQAMAVAEVLYSLGLGVEPKTPTVGGGDSLEA